MAPGHEDIQLLRCYVDNRSEEAFAELVRRHLRLVYNCALRRVGGDVHLAEDVAQQVFSALARDASMLSRREVLDGWLFTTTRFIAAQMVRTARRQHTREQKAHTMNQLAADSEPQPDWTQLRPVLDEVIEKLEERDRDAVLLRFFEGQSFAEVGARLRLTENAARMRVENLRLRSEHVSDAQLQRLRSDHAALLRIRTEMLSLRARADEMAREEANRATPK